MFNLHTRDLLTSLIRHPLTIVDVFLSRSRFSTGLGGARLVVNQDFDFKNELAKENYHGFNSEDLLRHQNQ